MWELTYIKDLGRYELFDDEGNLVPVVGDYLDWMAGSLNTKRNSGYALRFLFEWCKAKGISYTQLQTQDILSFQTWVTTTRDERSLNGNFLGAAKKLEDSSWNQYISRIKGFYKSYAEEILGHKKKINFSNLREKGRRGARKQKESLHSLKQETLNPKERYIYKEDIAKIIKGISERDRLIFALFYMTGIRIGELMTLRTHQFKVIPRNDGKLVFLFDVQWAQNKRIDEQPKTGKRMVIVSKNLARAISKYILFYRKTNQKKHEYIFTTESNTGSSKKGDPLRASSIRKMIKKAYAEVGLPEKRVHDIRHTWVTEMQRKTKNLKATQKLAGHKSIITTIHYDHTSDEELINEMSPAVLSLMKGIIDDY